MSEKYKNYRWKWDNYPKLYIESQIPIHLDLELTTRCNLNCKFCPRFDNNIEPMDMPFELAKKIIDEFVEKGGCSIKFVYLGEPLLYKNLGDIIKYAKDKGIIDTMIATNGTLLDNKIAYDLIKSGLDLIIFSIDSCKEEVYKQIRIGGILSRVKQGLIILNTLRQVLESYTPRIQIQAIPMEENKEEIKSGEYERFWSEYSDITRISPLCVNYGNQEIIGETPNFFCPSSFRRMTVRVNGDIAVCCGTRSKEKILGHFPENSLEEIWTSKKFRNIRRLMKERKSHLINICKSCPLRLNGKRENEND